jgi:hypothetical protein
MDQHKSDRLLAQAAMRAARRAEARGHTVDAERVVKPRPARAPHSEGRDVEALLERLRIGKGKRAARG